MGSSSKRKYAREIMDEHGLDSIGIQETQLDEFRDAWLNQIVAKQQFFGMFILLMEHMVVSLQE
jgi:hypothetical protein